MGDWSLMEGQLVDTVGEDLATSRGTTVTASSTANTKGSWAQLVAATTYDASGLVVFINKLASSDFLVDIGIGASGSERIIVPDLVAGYYTRYQAAVYYVPISIPAGVRIAARCQSISGGATLSVLVSLLSQGFLPSSSLGRVTAYGANTADSGGTSVDPGGVAHTKNAYSQINGATANPIRALAIGIGCQENGARTQGFWLVDIAVGAAGSEKIILPDVHLSAELTIDSITPSALGVFFIDIPAGVRLAARAQSSITDATDRLFDIVLYGID